MQISIFSVFCGATAFMQVSIYGKSEINCSKRYWDTKNDFYAGIKKVSDALTVEQWHMGIWMLLSVAFFSMWLNDESSYTLPWIVQSSVHRVIHTP